MKRKSIDFAYQTFLLTAGSALCALAVNGFLIPQGFLARGFTGIALLIHYQYPILSVGLLYLLINIPVFVLRYRLVGKRSALFILGHGHLFADAGGRCDGSGDRQSATLVRVARRGNRADCGFFRLFFMFQQMEIPEKKRSENNREISSWQEN